MYTPRSQLLRADLRCRCRRSVRPAHARITGQGSQRDFTSFPVLTTMSLHNHGTPKSSPTSKSRTEPSAASPAGPIERNESWQLR